MSKKFTEEQYQKIVEIGDGYNEPFIENLADYISGTGRFDDDDIYLSQAIAIANPLTREWAHDKFVEKEKKYYWTTKKEDSYASKGRLYNTSDGSIKSYFTNDNGYDNDVCEQLTESEIREWGYNPEMFNKEEVR